MDFSKFDKEIDTKQLAKDAEEAAKNGMGDFPEVPDGVYIARIESMELGETKDGRPMFKAMFRIIEAVEDGDFDRDNKEAMDFIENWPATKMPCIFMNRVVYGTKNDASMIGSVLGFLRELDSEVTPIIFENYSQLADLILDVMEDIDGILEYEITYKKKAFNNVSINEAFDAE